MLDHNAFCQLMAVAFCTSNFFMDIPVTVFTGFLGAGKTTIILDLLKCLPSNYNVVLLKNEFGDVKVDSKIANESNIKVTEMLNGCLCCVLVGQMKNALIEIKEKENPDRIIIETSGSAFPAPIAWQIRELKNFGFTLDSIITVIDTVNFCGYEDTSYTARIQAQYTDLILLNKHELCSERELDICIDHVNELNTDTPKLKWSTSSITHELIFGIDTKLFSSSSYEEIRGNTYDREHSNKEIDLINITSPPNFMMSIHGVKDHLNSLPKEFVYRVKGYNCNFTPGVVYSNDGPVILNWAFGRYTLTPYTKSDDNNGTALTVMGIELAPFVMKFQTIFPDAKIDYLGRS